MAQRMSTSRAVRPAALVTLLAMMLFDLLWVGCDDGRLGLELELQVVDKSISRRSECALCL